MPGGRPTKYEPWMAQKAYEHMSSGGTIFGLAKELGIRMSTLYDWLDENSPRFKPDFSEAYKKGFEKKKENYAQILEEAASNPKMKHPALLIFVAKTAYGMEQKQEKTTNITVNVPDPGKLQKD